MFLLVFAAVLGPTAYELYYLRYATSKNCLQIEIITGKRYVTTNRYKQTGSSMYGCNVQLGHSPDIYTRSLDPRITWSQQNEKKGGGKKDRDAVQGQRSAFPTPCARVAYCSPAKNPDQFVILLLISSYECVLTSGLAETNVVKNARSAIINLRYGSAGN